MQRWVLTSHVAAKALGKMEAMLSIDQELSVTKDVGMKRMNFDEEKVSQATDVISTWGNPFDESSSLINMASGLEAPDDVKKESLRQGCVLSPLLFNIYIDDMKNIFTEDCDPIDLDGTPINHLLYADDLIVMSTTSEGLKSSLRRIEEFYSKWKLTINIDKSKCLIFNAQGRLKTNETYKIAGQDQSKLRTYKLFKKELRAETYLNLPQFNFRKLIAKFRCSDHQLRIETGRHQKLEVSKRTCDMCKGQFIRRA